MDWTAGYASDVEYTAGFYREQSPTYLNFACVLNGYEPIALNKPYTYFELGFGRGLTVNLLAAANPNGHFYAADFNPSHVAGAQALAEAAHLPNITLLENSFEDLAQGKVPQLPQFDFITLHGIYTWVTAQNRDYIVQFISRYLKPGGLVYLSYNAMPGWSMALPLQRLLVEHASLHPNRSDKQIDAASQFVEQLETLQAGYFTANAGLKPRLAMLKTGSRNYLVHEYMHKHWQPLYFADVARDLSEAKLDFIGSADYAYAFQGLYLNTERAQMLNGIADDIMRQTLQDYLLNTSFRKDVFIRGARKLSPARQTELLSQVGVALIVPRKDIPLNLKLPFGEVNGKPEVYNPVLDALAVAPKTLAQLTQLPSLQASGNRNLVEVVAMLTAAGLAGLYFDTPKANPLPAKAFNQHMAEQARYSDDYQVFCSPLLGNGIHVAYLERVLYGLLQQNPNETNAQQLAQQAWQLMQAQGRRMLKDGAQLDTPQENINAIEQQFTAIMEFKIPVWRQLQLL